MPQVINGASDRSIEIWESSRGTRMSDRRRRTRANDTPVETEATVRVLSNGDLLQFLPRFTILSKSPHS